MSEQRPKCKCGNRAAVNYQRNGKTHYRKQCNTCIGKSKKQKKKINDHALKDHCEKCNFKAKHKEQLRPYALSAFVIKTVCCNCFEELKIDKNSWKQGDLVADF